MTESDAKQRWCPFARMSGAEFFGVSVNRNQDWDDSSPANCLCLASGCMAWRVISPLVPDDGYCGLAGSPRYLHFVRDHDGDDD